MTTLPAGSTLNITFHVAYPHRVSWYISANYRVKDLTHLPTNIASALLIIVARADNTVYSQL